MFLLCPKCWSELKFGNTDCPLCGMHVDLPSPKYQRRLLAALAHASPERRSQICQVLGSIGDRGAVPGLIELLHDPDIFVRVAALRALGEIGEPSSVAAVEKLTLCQNLIIRAVATAVLKMLIGTESAQSNRHTLQGARNLVGTRGLA
jgi:HEAT repeat protein